MISAGCGCVSLQEARARDSSLEAENRTRATPALKQTATALGAVLRPEVPVTIRTPRPCPGPNALGVGPTLPFADIAPSADVECFEAVAPGQPIYRLRRATERWLFVVVKARHAEYSRLALRGRTLCILTPRVTRERVGTEEQCECDGMPRPDLHELTGFLIPEQDFYEVQATDVPMIIEYVEWSCRAHAV
jgi:hypothetical protein